MKINTIYTTFQGEVNHRGIGASVIFLRTAGCHLRCYLKTMGILCDTPEALEGDSGTDMTTQQIIDRLNEHREASGGVNLVCLTGGDPLWRNPESLHDLFEAMATEGFECSVETSGTLSPEPYFRHKHVNWVLDYKLRSAGVKGNIVPRLADKLSRKDVIKFVVADAVDYQEMLTALREQNLWNSQANIVAGIMMGKGGELTTFELFELMKQDRLLGRVNINMQTHKMAFPNYETLLPTEI